MNPIGLAWLKTDHSQLYSQL